MKYEIRQRHFDKRWCIYSTKYNIVLAEFVDGVPKVNIDEIAHHLTNQSSGRDISCASCGEPIIGDIICLDCEKYSP